MIRHAAAVALAVWLSPSCLYAQSTVLTVTTPSADVYKSPSTGSPVIGHAPRGAVLEVTRELGSWVKVSWADAQDGVGYVHLTRGSLSHRSPPDPNRAAAVTSARPAPQPLSPVPTAVHTEQAMTDERPGLPRPVYVTPSTHVVGLGGRVGGSTLGFGATARAWRRDRFGMQLAVSRHAPTNPEAPGGVTSIQFEPSVLYSLRDRVTDYWWMRPYMGAGVNFNRQTLRTATPGTANSLSENNLGLQVFGGGELTFAGMPQFALSADLGYLWARTPFASVELGGFGVAVSGHWYVK